MSYHLINDKNALQSWFPGGHASLTQSTSRTNSDPNSTGDVDLHGLHWIHEELDKKPEICL